MKIVWWSLLAGLAMAAGAQPPHAMHGPSKGTKPAVDSYVLMDRYFPFHPGEVRTYSYRGETADGPGPDPPTKTFAATYTETVIDVQDTTPRHRIVRLEISGGLRGADHTRCGIDPVEADPTPDDRLKAPWRFSYLFEGRFVLLKCDPGPNVPGETPSSYRRDEEELEYILPLRVGRGWGQEPKRRDTCYGWYIAGQKTVSVPAGTFKNCFRLIYNTLPDDLQRWICPGTGLVAEEYTHHGTQMHSRIELISITTPPGEKRQP
jgi:hypothetical protein